MESARCLAIYRLRIKFCKAPRTSLNTVVLAKMASNAPRHFVFGPWKCPWTEAFYLTPLTIGIVNTKPIVPGHCLVLPRRVVARVYDLTSEELADLMQTTAKIARGLEREFKGESMTYAVQDGPAAGQTVPHVHFHLLPRKTGDFARNDMIYEEVENWKRIRMDDDKERKN